MKTVARPLGSVAVGERAASALGDAGGRPAADVHEALGLLARRPSPCLVEAAALAESPRRALSALVRAAEPHPVVVLRDPRAPGAGRVEAAARLLRVSEARATEEARALLGTDLRPLPDGRVARARRGKRRDVVKDRLPKDRESDDGALEEAAFLQGCFRRLERPDSLCRFVLKTLCRASGARRASLMLLDPSRSALFVKAARGLDPGLVGRVRASLGTGVAGRAASTGRAVAGRGSPGGPRRYVGSAFVVLPLGSPAAGEGVANLTDLPGDRVPSRTVMRRLRRMARRAGRALGVARRLESAEALSATDDLTRLPNRRSFERGLRREIERARRSGASLAVALVDVDRFKSFNDRFGHPVGDRVLEQIARRLASAVRETDLVARWGGEEFAVLLTALGEAAGDEAVAVLERARAAVGGKPLSLGAGLPAPSATVSAGVAVFPEDAQDPATVLRRADEALYEAKRAGRDRVHRA